MKRKGIGTKMLQEIFRIARERQYSALFLHTAAGAHSLVRWYLREGFQKIGLAQFAGTNYYNIHFRKATCGRPYIPIFAGVLFAMRSVKTRLLVSETGTPRLLMQILRALKRFLFR